MTTPDALANAARAYLQKWRDYLAANPDIDRAAVDAAMKAGELPPQTAEEPITFGVDTAVFDNSPLAEVYYIVLADLKENDPAKKARAWHSKVALWVAWESHRIAPTEDGTAGDLLKMVGLPKTQKELAALLGVSSRTLRNYATTYSSYVSTARESGVGRILGLYDQHALHALGMMASTPSPQAASDRRTFFTMRGYLVDKADVTSGGEKLAQPVVIVRAEEWEAL